MLLAGAVWNDPALTAYLALVGAVVVWVLLGGWHD